MKKKLLILLSLTIFAIGVLLISFQNKSKSDVGELLIKSEVNLGNVNLDSKKDFEVDITNTSNQNYIIGKIYTSCGCTKVVGYNSEAITLKPKKTSTIIFEFDPALMHQKGDTINHEAYFLVTSPTEKEYKVKIIGKVV